MRPGRCRKRRRSSRTPNPRAHSAQSQPPARLPPGPGPTHPPRLAAPCHRPASWAPERCRRGCCRQLVRFDDHGGGLVRLGYPRRPPLATNPSACAPLRRLPGGQGRGHRPAVVRAALTPPLLCPAHSRPARPTKAREGQNIPRLVLWVPTR